MTVYTNVWKVTIYDCLYTGLGLFCLSCKFQNFRPSSFIANCLLRHRREHLHSAVFVVVLLPWLIAKRQSWCGSVATPPFQTHAWIWLRPTHRAFRFTCWGKLMVSGLRHHPRQPLKLLEMRQEWDNSTGPYCLVLPRARSLTFQVRGRVSHLLTSLEEGWVTYIPGQRQGEGEGKVTYLSDWWETGEQSMAQGRG